MNDIIRMAREAGLSNDFGRFGYPYLPELERFAALVRADERNKLAQWMIDRSYATGHGDTVEDLLRELEGQVREYEREACAQVAEDMLRFYTQAVTGVPQAIRARGQS
jgi:hypothetical protein